VYGCFVWVEFSFQVDYVQQHRTDGAHASFKLQTTHPVRVFGGAEFALTLQEAGGSL
jgi:hypothetical protein